MNRRTLLTAGGGVIAAAGFGLGWRAWDQGLIGDPARPGLEAWDDWNRRIYPAPLSIVAGGLLAASPHNTQPWSFAVGMRGVDIFEVPERNLGAMDPFGRERILGLGAAIANMEIAATASGLGTTTRLLPDPGNPRHMARLATFRQAAAPHPLAAAIGHRHTNRFPWAGGPVADDALQALLATALPDARVAIIDAASPRGKRFAALTEEANAAIVADPEMAAASHLWTRHSRREQDRYKDGLALRTSGVSPRLEAAAMLLPDLSPETEGRYWLQATRDSHLPTASAFGLVVVGDTKDRRAGLRAGGVWQRLQLTATGLGLASQPLNQLLEMIDRDTQLGRPPRFARAANALLDDPAWRPTFAFRIGHATTRAPVSFRRPVSEVLGPPARLDWDVGESRAAAIA